VEASFGAVAIAPAGVETSIDIVAASKINIAKRRTG
jgi:hypothetical protein